MADIRVASNQGEVIFYLPKRITLGEGSVTLRDTIRSLAKGGFSKVVLDLDKTTYVDSSGIGELVSAYTFTRNNGGYLKLNRLVGKTKDLLEITKLASIFEVTQHNWDSLPSIQIESSDISPLKAAEALPLILSLQNNHIRVEVGIQEGLYKVTSENAIGSGPLLLASPQVLSTGSRTIFYEKLQEFEELINTKAATENDIHRFLEANPNILLGRDYRQLHSKVLLKRDDDGPLIPDFFLQPFDSELCDVLELKLPDVPVIVGTDNRRRFSSAVYSAIAQLRTYSDYFEDRAKREDVAARYGLKIYRPKLSVVIGRLSSIDPIEYRQITSAEKNVEIVTYDDLLARAKRLLIV